MRRQATAAAQRDLVPMEVPQFSQAAAAGTATGAAEAGVAEASGAAAGVAEFYDAEADAPIIEASRKTASPVAATSEEKQTASEKRQAASEKRHAASEKKQAAKEPARC